MSGKPEERPESKPEEHPESTDDGYGIEQEIKSGDGDQNKK